MCVRQTESLPRGAYNLVSSLACNLIEWRSGRKGEYTKKRLYIFNGTAKFLLGIEDEGLCAEILFHNFNLQLVLRVGTPFTSVTTHLLGDSTT